jgi:hypothetical protein
MDKWSALIPTTSYAAPKIVNDYKYTSRSLNLVGRLPEEAFLRVFAHLPLPDVVNLARGNKRLAKLSKHESIWKRKWDLMDWKGGEEVLGFNDTKGKGKAAEAPLSSRSSISHHRKMSWKAVNGSRAPVTSAFAIGEEDDFDDFIGSSQTNDDFGEFETSGGDDIGFARLSVNQPTPKEDLLINFEDSDGQNSEKIHKSRRLSVQEVYNSSGLSYRDLFIALHGYLLPFYISFQSKTTNSLLFSSRHLSALERAHILSSLFPFTLNYALAPTRSSESRQIVGKNLRDAADFLESGMLNEFEKLAEKEDEAGMKSRIEVLAGLNRLDSVVQL